MTAPIIRSTSRGQLVPLIFAQDAVAASQTNVQLVVPGETTTPLVEGYEMPFAGEIVALSYTLNAAGTAGVFTIGATVKANGLMAVYNKGRVSWDSKLLDGYAVAHPEILAARKEGDPSVTIRTVK